MSIYLPYVYLVIHKDTKEFYIGMRSANKLSAELDLGIKYFTSNKYVRQNFNNFNINILANFIDRESAFYFENLLIKENWDNPLLLNKHYQKNISSFSMAGAKRPDLADFNRKTKTLPKIERIYICQNCNVSFTRLEGVKNTPKNIKTCSRSCQAKLQNKNRPQKEPKIKACKTPWNKGSHNPHSAENGRKGAEKQSKNVKGRTRKYLEDGSWVWNYTTEYLETRNSAKPRDD